MDILPDVIKPGLKVIFCGMAAGNRSATIGSYYAGRGNQFWAVLYRIGLTPRQLQPREYRSLLSYGIGLTDLVKSVSGNDNTLDNEFFDILSACGSVWKKRLQRWSLLMVSELPWNS
ncbi:G/U mismatch-specific DNA glycosylase [Moorella humiferrea]|uniref:mismatch-specific DNA-glycosylase n=1 Tax=Neomoorella humiferrea TaxID=676965 RepID=UPI00324B2B91